MKNVSNNLAIRSLTFLLVGFVFLLVANSSAQDFEDEEFTQETATSKQETQTDPIKLFNQGQDAHAKGDLKTALKFYERALKEKPNFVEAEFQRATILVSFGRLVEAEKSFRKTLELKPDWNLALIGLGSVLNKGGNFSEAEDLLFKAITISPSNFAAYRFLTENFLSANAPKAKLLKLHSQLKKVTTFRNTPASIWVSKGLIERTLGDLETANSSIETALRLEPKNRTALTEAALIALEKKDSKAAVKKAQSLIKIYPDSVRAKTILARAFDSNEQTAEALEILATIKNPDPSVVAITNTIRFRGNKNPKDLEALLANDQKNVSILGKLCSIMRTRDPKKALDYCQRALELEKSNINYAIGYGAALVQLKQYPKAVAVFRNLLKYDSKNYTVRANLATALFQMQQFELAKVEYQWIVSKKPDLAIGFYLLAICYDRLGEYEDAQENYEQFLELADAENNSLEIEKVNLRLPILLEEIRTGKKRKGRGE